MHKTQDLMSGFLTHLVQRTLAKPSGIRPRPVSPFESPQPLLVSETLFTPAHEAGTETITREPVQRVQRPGSLRKTPDGKEVQSALSGPDAAGGKSEGGHETLLRSDASSRLYEDLERRKVRRAGSPETRQQSTLLKDSLVETDVAGFSVQRPLQVFPFLPREQPTTPPAEIQFQAGRNQEKLLNGSEHLQPMNLTSNPSPTGGGSDRKTVAATDSIHQPRIEAPAKPAGRFHVQNTETNPRPSATENEAATPPAAPARITVREPLGQRPVVDPERSAAVTLRPLTRDRRREESAASRGILLPRVPQVEPISRLVQPLKERSPGPTIHVSIGRVEIRAVSAPRAQKRSAPSKPALSLSDYLSRRNGGSG
jgi:hypothetical protein